MIIVLIKYKQLMKSVLTTSTLSIKMFSCNWFIDNTCLNHFTKLLSKLHPKASVINNNTNQDMVIHYCIFIQNTKKTTTHLNTALIAPTTSTATEQQWLHDVPQNGFPCNVCLLSVGKDSTMHCLLDVISFYKRF